MAMRLSLRIAKAPFDALGRAPLVLAAARRRARWGVHGGVLALHLRGCPAGVGLGRCPAPEMDAAEGRCAR